MQLNLRLAAAAGLALGAWASQAGAVETTYSSLAAFQAAAGPTTLETFNSMATGVYGGPGAFSFNTTAGLTISGNGNGDNVGISGDPSFTPPNGSGNYYFFTDCPQNFSDNTGCSGNGNTGPTTIFSNAGTLTALGFDFHNYDSSDRYRITVNGVNYDNVITFGASGFFGITSTTGFSSLQIATLSFGGVVSPVTIDNVRFAPSGATSGAVPEPAAWAMMIAGFGGVGGLMRRRRAGAVTA
jgi:hypothetical protein